MFRDRACELAHAVHPGVDRPARDVHALGHLVRGLLAHEQRVEELVIARAHATGERHEHAIERLSLLEPRDELALVTVVEVVGIGGRIRPWVAHALTQDPGDASARDEPHEAVEVATARGVPSSQLASIALEQRDQDLLNHVVHVLAGVAAAGHGGPHQAKGDLALDAVEQSLGELAARRTVACERARDEVLVGRRHDRRVLRRVPPADKPDVTGPRADSLSAKMPAPDGKGRTARASTLARAAGHVSGRVGVVAALIRRPSANTTSNGRDREFASPRLRSHGYPASQAAEVSMGDKSPKSKRRAQKQKQDAKKDASAKAASKQPTATPPAPSQDASPKHPS